MFYYIISTIYQEIGDLFCHVHTFGLSHSVPTTNHNFNYGAGATFYVTCSLLPLTFGKLLVFYRLFLLRSTYYFFQFDSNAQMWHRLSLDLHVLNFIFFVNCKLSDISRNIMVWFRKIICNKIKWGHTINEVTFEPLISYDFTPKWLVLTMNLRLKIHILKF